MADDGDAAVAIEKYIPIIISNIALSFYLK
jgi:hypothetical protein